MDRDAPVLRPGARLLLVLAALAAAASLAGAARAAGPWCGGTEEVAADRLPDAASGQQIHVVYAFPSDGPDRFATVAPQLVDDLAAADVWWRGQDPTRTLRFDRFAFPGCASGAGTLDISAIRLPHEGAYYDVATRDQAMRLEVDLAPVQANPYKKYLLFYDGPASLQADVCGHSPTEHDAGGLAATAIVLLDQGEGCGTLGNANYIAVTAVHELVHDLGAVPPQPGPPHACPGDEGHVCDSDFDLLRGGGGRFPDLASYQLDVGHDDYYAHSGSWWDVQDSSWLVHLDAPQLPVTVRFAGSGGGTVASDLPGLLCTASCAVDWQAGTLVRLQAQPEAGIEFVGWSGACSGTGDCDLTVDAPKDVVARFEQTLDLTATVVSRGGTGVLTFSTGDDCSGGTCVTTTTKGAVVDVRAVPAAGSRFVGWTGACTGTGQCSVLLDAAKSIGAVFASATARVSVAVRGKGTVVSTPTGLRCPGRCAAAFRFGASVRLAAHPTRGWRFAGWSGACNGPGRCVVQVGSARAVSARFAKV